MTIQLPACMGGWCRRREGCADYHATDRKQIAERLCAKGEDRPQPVRIVEAVDNREEVSA